MCKRKPHCHHQNHVSVYYWNTDIKAEKNDDDEDR